MLPEIILFVAFLFTVLSYVTKKAQRTPPLPPGPRKYPIIGNLLKVPSDNHWVVYDRLAKECNSDIIHLSVFGNSVIVLNSFAAATEVLDRQSSISSSRPLGTMIGEIMGWKYIFSLQPYGQRWRDSRRMFWQEFHPEHGRAHHRPIQLRCSRDLIRRLYESPIDFQNHVRHAIGAGIISVLYGLDIQEEDPNITMVDDALKHINVGLIGTCMVDLFPFLRHIPRWVPGAGFRAIGESAARDLNLLIDVPYSQTRKLLVQGRGESSFIHRTLSRGPIPDGGMEERILKEAATTTYIGANETSKLPMTLLFAMMAQNPDVQTKAQQELDQYLDHRRLPEFGDEIHLPYTYAVLLELLRYPSCLPRSLVSDGKYKSYHLPSGSIVFYNIWAILHDETTFPEPEKFNPSRFLKDGVIDTQLKDRVMATFGFGRRVCPGRYFALDNLWLNLASILSVYTMSKAVDESGQQIEIDLEYTADLNRRHVLPFRCSITPRSEKAEKLIHGCCL
ncbi:hypothetical protein PLEOSDRAFT_1050675 [Pleurotus ostreatus PC15]|uniref:Cytochrome P450 n=1 Tax=Pleurotus ostreatus (strain PC15) TaxID=1137138 RepID=A0A067N579_PLEO1|nr:hypothetical protein PLEOSDRAFT_1050675 [Pleurotus ostreatus PC15]